MNRVLLSAENLAIGYSQGHRVLRTVLDGVSCSVRPGELVSLIGPNGIGKSTLLRTLGGLQTPLKGKVCLCERDIHEFTAMDRATKIGFVLTDRVRVGSMKVKSLVALGRYPHTPWSGALGKKDRAAVDASLEMTDLAGLADRYFSELSDGEKQKVMLARAIAQEPKLLILDEPTAFLDLPRRIEVVRILKRLTRQSDIAVLMSSHDLDLALKTSDRLWIMSRNALTSGAPEDLVLNGSLEQAFSGHGLIFNTAEGQFVTHEPHGTVVYLSGGGVETAWTRRALERDGYSVETGIGDPLVRVGAAADGKKLQWTLHINGDSRVFETIFDLISSLRLR